MRPGAIDGDETSAGRGAATVLNADIAIRFAFSSTPAGTGFAWTQPGLGLPALGRLVWRYSTVNERVTRFNGTLNSETLPPPAAKDAQRVRGLYSGVHVLHGLGRREGQLLRCGDLDFLAVGRIAALAFWRSFDLELTKPICRELLPRLWRVQKSPFQSSWGTGGKTAVSHNGPSKSCMRGLTFSSRSRQAHFAHTPALHCGEGPPPKFSSRFV
jgi:hypothetical protein